MLIYLDGCSWVAGHGLPKEKNLANTIQNLCRSIEVIDFSYNGKSNHSIVEDVFLNIKDNSTKIDKYVIGLTTPYRYCIHTDDNFRIDILKDMIGTVKYMNGPQPGTPPAQIDYISQVVASLARVNSLHHYEINTVQCLHALKCLTGKKLLGFNVFPYHSKLFSNLVDSSCWLSSNIGDGLELNNDCFLPDRHLNEKGMNVVARKLVDRLTLQDD